MKPSRTGRDETNIARNQLEKEQGFTIIEVLLAISILAVGLLAVAAMQFGAIHVNYTADKVTTRATYAQDRLERLNALPYTDPLLVDNDADVGDVTSYGDPDPNPPADISVTYTVDDNNPVTGTKRIELTVTEPDGTSITLVTVKSSNI